VLHRSISQLTANGYRIDPKARRSITKTASRAKVEAQNKDVPRELRGTFGGVGHFVEQRSRAKLEAAGNFGHHTVYTVGEPKIDPETQTICIAMTSENLALNAYRQTCYAMPTYVCVDSTYRLIVEGHNCMLFGTTGPDQRFHAFGMGICSSEDEAAHLHVIRCLQAEINRLVARKRLAGERV